MGDCPPFFVTFLSNVRISNKNKAMKKRIFKTKISFVILSEEELPECTSLGSIIDGCDDGNYIMGNVNIDQKEKIGKDAANAVTQTGSDPEFFGMDGQGYVLNEY